MQLVHDDRNNPFGYIWVDPLKCIGCKKCITKGTLGTIIEGCPWDAILMTPLTEVEEMYGTLEY
jgi:ferredoxin